MLEKSSHDAYVLLNVDMSLLLPPAGPITSQR